MAMLLTQRQLTPEVMDDPALDAASHRAALHGLSRINSVSRAGALLWPTVREALRRAHRPLRLLDVACGGGDVAIDLHHRARRAGMPLTVHACDLSARAIAFGRERARTLGARVSFEQRDVIADGLPDGYDVITCSLFLHHLSRDGAVDVLQQMGRRADVVVVSDLQRSCKGLIAAKVCVRALTRSPVVRTDAPQSVRAAFSIPELVQMAREAGLDGARVRRGFPFRMLLTWSRG